MRILLLLALLLPSFHAAERPNILFLYTDDHSHRTVSCYPEAYDFARTPNIDRLAERGVRFAHATIGTWCMPSRATMLTGKLQHGVQTMRMEGEYPGSTYDPEACPFWPSVFRKNGYQTAQIGKWHTGIDSGFGRDWDYQVVWNRPKYPKNAGAYFDHQLIETNGGPPVMTDGYTTDRYSDLAIDYIKGDHREKGKPWYLWVCWGAVHGPFTPADRHLEDYPDPEFPLPADIFPPREGKPTYAREWQEWVPDAKGEPVVKSGIKQRTVDTAKEYGKTLRDSVRQYHQAVRGIDEGVGRILAALEESGQLENTLVVLTADQGFGWGQHGFRRKLAPYDATIRGPLIISMPGTLPEGTVVEAPVSGPDLPPTFFAFAGLELPWKMHGHDLTPLLKDPKSDWPHRVLMTYTAQQYGANTDTVPTDKETLMPGGVPWWVSIIDGRHKYIRTLVADEPEEIYDLKADPEELHNLALDPKMAARLKELRELAKAELRRTDAGFVEAMPPVATE